MPGYSDDAAAAAAAADSNEALFDAAKALFTAQDYQAALVAYAAIEPADVKEQQRLCLNVGTCFSKLGQEQAAFLCYLFGLYLDRETHDVRRQKMLRKNLDLLPMMKAVFAEVSAMGDSTRAGLMGLEAMFWGVDLEGYYLRTCEGPQDDPYDPYRACVSYVLSQQQLQWMKCHEEDAEALFVVVDANKARAAYAAAFGACMTSMDKVLGGEQLEAWSRVVVWMGDPDQCHLGYEAAAVGDPAVLPFSKLQAHCEQLFVARQPEVDVMEAMVRAMQRSVNAAAVVPGPNQPGRFDPRMFAGLAMQDAAAHHPGVDADNPELRGIADAAAEWIGAGIEGMAYPGGDAGDDRGNNRPPSPPA